MHIDIWLDGTDPPEGRVGDDGRDVAFSGWIDLLSVLSRLLESVREVDGELGARPQSELGEDV